MVLTHVYYILQRVTTIPFLSCIKFDSLWVPFIELAIDTRVWCSFLVSKVEIYEVTAVCRENSACRPTSLCTTSWSCNSCSVQNTNKLFERLRVVVAINELRSEALNSFVYSDKFQLHRLEVLALFYNVHIGFHVAKQ